MITFATYYSSAMVGIFDDMSQITEAEVQRMLHLVNEQRREQALRYKHLFGQFACLKSWLMLQELLRPLDIIDLEMGHNEHGKPFLVHHPQVHFNLSHCRNGIAVAVDFSPIGIDIESFRQGNLALIRRTMNPAEAEWIRTSPDPIETFTQYWTKKEAVVKLRGTGITDDLHHVLDGEGYRLKTHINREKRYAFSIAFSETM
ncbi:MAG: 4'-phosphopantetheinyl transferase superfamily protein [Bacteroidales bacterium]|nr:4'-phosphopantetheinyl transferase superfamily protein [Bacteroidales bacterium]